MVFQIGSALLDACVLSALEEEPLYGYALTQKVKSVVDISESTLYPVLRRLTKDGLLSTYDQPFNGRNRRYYVLTDYGKSQLIFLRNEWISYKEMVLCQEKVQVKHELFTSIICLMPHLFPFVLVLSNISFRSH